MKKISFLLFVIAASYLPLSAQWTYVGAQHFSTSFVDYISLTVDGSGTPYTAYWDDASAGQFVVEKYSGGSWNQVGTAQWATNFNQAYHECIKVSATGTPYVFSADYNYGGVKKFTGGNWTFVGDSQFTLLRPEYLDMAIAPNGNLFTVYSDYYMNYQPTVMRYDGVKWDSLSTRFLTTDQAYYDHIAVDASNTPYVVFSDAGVSDKVTVMKYNGSTWVTVGTRGFSTGQADYTSIAIDHSGSIYVGYVDNSTQKANVKKFDGTSWVTVGTADFSDVAHSMCMVLDPNGVPYVAYGNSNDATVSVMKLSGSAWALVGAAGFVSAVDMSLAMSPSGVPYLAYTDNTQEISVMKYGGSAGIAEQTDDIQVQLYPDPASTILQIRTDAFVPETVTVYDLSGQKIIEQPYTGSVDAGALSSGLYVIELRSTTASVTRRFTKL